MQTITTRSQRFSPVRILAIGLILYACAFASLLRNRSFEPSGAIIVLVLFGGVFPLLAWAATLRAVPLSISVRPSASALIALTGYVILLSLYLIGGPQWIDQHLPHLWVDSAQIRFFIGLVKKLVVFVVIPFAIFRFGFGYRVRDFGIQREGLRARTEVDVLQQYGARPDVFEQCLRRIRQPLAVHRDNQVPRGPVGPRLGLGPGGWCLRRTRAA